MGHGDGETEMISHLPTCRGSKTSFCPIKQGVKRSFRAESAVLSNVKNIWNPIENQPKYGIIINCFLGNIIFMTHKA